jgi:hypothetical protein
LPSQSAEAWTGVQPPGKVSEYPYVSEVNVVGSADGDIDGDIDGDSLGELFADGLTDPLGDPVEQATRVRTLRRGAARAAMAIFASSGLRLTLPRTHHRRRSPRRSQEGEPA